MIQYLASKHGVDFLEMYYHCRHCIHQNQNIPFVFYVYFLHLTSIQWLSIELQSVCTSASLSFVLPLTPLRCIPVTAFHVRKVCQFPCSRCTEILLLL